LKERDDNDHTTLKQLIYLEENRSDFRLIKKLLKGNRSKRIKHLDVPDPKNLSSWKCIFDQQSIKKTSLERNIAHFGQAIHKPFAFSNLGNVFGYCGVNTNSLKLTNKGIIPLEVNDENIYTQKFIEKFSKGQVAHISEDIKLEEFTAALNKWNKNTTKFPSGQHL
jgi:hypothetical protein